MFQLPWTKLANENAQLRLNANLDAIAILRERAKVERLENELHETKSAVDALKGLFDLATEAHREHVDTVNQTKAEQTFLQNSIAHAKQLVAAELANYRAKPLQSKGTHIALLYTLETIVSNIGEALPVSRKKEPTPKN